MIPTTPPSIAQKIVGVTIKAVPRQKTTNPKIAIPKKLDIIKTVIIGNRRLFTPPIKSAMPHPKHAAKDNEIESIVIYK